MAIMPGRLYFVSPVDNAITVLFRIVKLEKRPITPITDEIKY